MADNYLERRMDDLHNRQLHRPQTRPLHPSGSHVAQNGISVSLTGKRVLVAGGASGLGLSIARAFIPSGCKVAVFDSEDSCGRQMAYAQGVRFHPVRLDDPEALCNAFSALLKAWRDVDMVILADRKITFAATTAVIGIWSRHRTRYPVPSAYGFRLIIISGTMPRSSSQTTIKDITVNHIIIPESTDTESWSRTEEAVSRTCLFLSLPACGSISGAVIPITL